MFPRPCSTTLPGRSCSCTCCSPYGWFVPVQQPCVPAVAGAEVAGLAAAGSSRAAGLCCGGSTCRLEPPRACHHRRPAGRELLLTSAGACHASQTRATEAGVSSTSQSRCSRDDCPTRNSSCRQTDMLTSPPSDCSHDCKTGQPYVVGNGEGAQAHHRCRSKEGSRLGTRCRCHHSVAGDGGGVAAAVAVCWCGHDAQQSACIGAGAQQSMCGMSCTGAAVRVEVFTVCLVETPCMYAL